MSDASNPQRYASPELVLDDASLSDADKRKRLEQWKLDLELELNATDENMPPLDSKGDAKPGIDASKSEMLRRVSDCMLKLEKAA